MLARFIRWVLSLFVIRPSGTFRPKERMIYVYFDGRKDVKADPMILYRRLMDRRMELSSDIKAAFSGSPKFAAKAYTKMIDNIREIFQVKPLDEGGLTEPEAGDLLAHFMDWTEDLKKNSRMFPTPATETQAPSESSLEGDQPTPNTSVSGSTASAPSTEEPPPSPSEPPSPSGPSTPVLNTSGP